MNRSLSFSAGTVVRKDLVFIAAQIEELNEQGVDHTKILRWKDGAWAHYMIDWPVTAIQHMHDGAAIIFSMGLYGKIHVAQGKERRVEEVDPSVSGPSRRGVLRDMRLVDGTLYVSGMQRQVYKRIGRDQWERVDHGLVLPVGEKAIKSLDSIDGFGDKDVYGVGMNGEAWHRRGDFWHLLDVPASVSFEKVLCVPSGVVYVAGQLGTLIAGHGDQWDVLDTGDLRDTIWDLAWFKERLFATTSTSLLVLRDGQLEPVDLGLGSSWTFGNLASNEDVLWSVGRSHLAYTGDGVAWTEAAGADASY